MTSLDQIEEQLKAAGCNFRFWGRAEIRELKNVLAPGETIAHIANGRYEGGFAMLCVTDHRLLLIDRKPMFLALEDLRFDMIVEITYSARLLDSTVSIVTPGRTLRFNSWSQPHLRAVLNYTQQRVMEMRQQFMQQQFQQQMVADQNMAMSLAGGLALQTSGVNQAMGAPAASALPMNPYNKMPLLMRRRRYPKFY